MVGATTVAVWRARCGPARPRRNSVYAGLYMQGGRVKEYRWGSADLPFRSSFPGN